MEGDLFEIKGGRMALAKSHNAAVRRLGARLVSDHTMSYNNTAAIARRLGVDVPTTPSPSEQWELKIVSTFRGRSFDRWYSSLEMYDHRQDIEESTDEIKDGSDKTIRDDARTAVPMLRHHLALATAAFKAS